MTALWVVPFVLIFGGKQERRRLHHIRQAQAWWRTALGDHLGFEGLLWQLKEVYEHERGKCNNFSWCVRSRIDPDYEWEIPVPEYLTAEEVTQGWLLT
jgi:hypothetical protein